MALDSVRTLRARDGVPIAYRLWRPGTPRRTLVLIHGAASNLTRWSEFVAATRLAEGWDLLRLDLRGHGDSLTRGRTGMDEWCADLLELLHAESVPRVVLVGHCLGANVALRFAHRVPGATAGLVLIEPMFRQALRGSLATVAKLRSLIAMFALGLRAVAALGVHRHRLQRLDLAELDRAARDAMAGTGGRFPAERYASPWEDLRSMPTAIYLQDLLALTGPPPDLPAISAPVLAMLSKAASLGDPEIAASLLSRMPRCRIVRLDAQHWIPTEQPLLMRQLIEDWCQALGGVAD